MRAGACDHERRARRDHHESGAVRRTPGTAHRRRRHRRLVSTIPSRAGARVAPSTLAIPRAGQHPDDAPRLGLDGWTAAAAQPRHRRQPEPPGSRQSHWSTSCARRCIPIDDRETESQCTTDHSGKLRRMLWNSWQRGPRLSALPEAIAPLRAQKAMPCKRCSSGHRGSPVRLEDRGHQCGRPSPYRGGWAPGRQAAARSGRATAVRSCRWPAITCAWPSRSSLFAWPATLPPRATPYTTDEVLGAVAHVAPGDRSTRLALRRVRHGRRGRNSSPTTPAPTTSCWARRRRRTGASWIWSSTW